MKQHKPQLKANIVNLYLSGAKIAEIVSQTGVPRSTVYSWINTIQTHAPLNVRDYHFLKQKCERQEKIIQILKAAPCTANAPLHEKLDAIEQMVSTEYNVNTLCEALNVAKGTYYNHILRSKNGNTQAAIRRKELLPMIEEIYHESNQIYGPGKVAAIMKDRGITVGESTVTKIMHENNLFSIRGGAKKLHEMNKQRKENLLRQDFKVSRPNEVWVSDITYLNYGNKNYYLCIIIDLYARKVVAWKISTTNSTHLTKATIKMACADRKPLQGLIFHSDNGSNYTSKAFRKFLQENKIQQSFSRAHNPYDNSVCESFFNNFKREEYYRKDYRSVKELYRSIDEYMLFYNEKRPHAMNGYMSPNKAEAAYFARNRTEDV